MANPEELDVVAVEVQRITKGVVSFAEDMRDKGIHVGLGTSGGPVRCCACNELWPCEGGERG